MITSVLPMKLLRGISNLEVTEKLQGVNDYLNEQMKLNINKCKITHKVGKSCMCTSCLQLAIRIVWKTL